MTKEELIEFLKYNLEIECRRIPYENGYRVVLLLDREEISSDSLPDFIEE